MAIPSDFGIPHRTNLPLINADNWDILFFPSALNEKEKLKRAFEATVDQIQKVADQAKQISNEESAIIEAQRMYLSDQSLWDILFFPSA